MNKTIHSMEKVFLLLLIFVKFDTNLAPVAAREQQLKRYLPLVLRGYVNPLKPCYLLAIFRSIFQSVLRGSKTILFA